MLAFSPCPAPLASHRLIDAPCRDLHAVLGHMQAVEIARYPTGLRSLSELPVQSWRDLQAYCGSDTVLVLVDDHGYALLTDRALCDVASARRRTPLEIFQIFWLLEAHFGDRSFSAMVRETTMWRLLQYLAYCGRLTLHNPQKVVRGGETFRRVDLTIVPRQN